MRNQLLMAALVALVGCAGEGMPGDPGGDDDDGVVGDDDSADGDNDGVATGVDALGAGAEGVDADCDVAYTRTVTSASTGNSSETSGLYVEVAAPPDVRRVWYKGCGQHYLGTQSTYCPDNSECVGSQLPPLADCVVGDGADLIDGKARIYCGYRFANTVGGVTTVTGVRTDHFTVWFE